MDIIADIMNEITCDIIHDITVIITSLPYVIPMTYDITRYIWILGTLISSFRRSILNETFDIEDFDIECLFDIDVFYLRYRLSISNVFDIE